MSTTTELAVLFDLYQRISNTQVDATRQTLLLVMRPVMPTLKAMEAEDKARRDGFKIVPRKDTPSDNETVDSGGAAGTSP